MTDQPENKVVSLAGHTARQNHKLKGPADIMYGEVTSVTDLTTVSAVAFGVRNGTTEKLFWISTDMQKDDPDYRRPLTGESVKVWFNEAAQSLQTPEGPAQGVVELRNISNDSEAKAFAWFAAKRDGKPLPPAN